MITKVLPSEASSALPGLRYRAAPDGAPAEFPAPDGIPQAWAEVLRLAQATRRCEVSALMGDLLGGEAKPEDLAGLTHVHHAGIYAGDYADDGQVLAWCRFLDGLAAAGELRSADHGPSYIAPRQYGTQGWWSSVVCNDGFVIETFCCRAYGGWLKRGAAERARLMSHAALAVAEREKVLPILEGLAARHDGIEVIAYTPGDELGHCYGHLRNNANHVVVELVHGQDQEAPHA